MKAPATSSPNHPRLVPPTRIPPLRTLGHDDWVTPPEVFDPVHEALRFNLDACASDAQVARCVRYIPLSHDALDVRWADYGTRVWCNPPYGRTLPKWFEAVTQAMQDGLELCAMLVMANTDTSYWHRYVRGIASEVIFLSPRVRFCRPDGALVPSSAPKGSALVIYDTFASNQTTHSYWHYLTEPLNRRSP